MGRPFFVGLLIFGLTTGWGTVRAGVAPDFGDAKFIAGRLPARDYAGSPPIAVYVTSDDVLIPFLPDFPRRHASALWSLRHGRIVASKLTIGKEHEVLPTLGVTEFNLNRATTLMDFDAYDPKGRLGKKRIRLNDGTFLEQSGLSSLGPCEPLGNYFFMVEDENGNVLRRKAFASFDPRPKKVDWNSGRCSETWGDDPVLAAVHYSQHEYFKIYLIGEKILFMGDNGDFLLTNSELDGPQVDSPLVVVDLEILNATKKGDGATTRADNLAAAALLEARDAALERTLRTGNPK